MSIKIRCDQCSKKILVDEGFAGGACRCPYCKAIVMVPGDSDASVGARPEAPGGAVAPGGRPEAPGSVQGAAQESQFGGGAGGAPAQAPPSVARGTAVAGGAARANVPATAHIPMAKPVKIQGIVTLILFGLMAAMLAGAVVVAAMVVGKHAKGGGSTVGGGGPEAATGQVPSGEHGPAPAAIGGLSVLGEIKIAPPVVYVIDGGASMSDTYDAAFALTRGSIKTLASDQKFSVVVAGESQDGQMGDFVGGGPAGVGAAKKFFEEVRAGYGASNLARAIDAALALKPATIIIFCRKPVPGEAGEKAKAGGAKVVGIAMDAGSDCLDSLAEIARQTGGQAKALSKGDLRNLGDDSD